MEEKKTMINWRKKLLSRKFWLAAASFVTLVMAAFGAPQSAGAQVSEIIMSGAAVVAYIIGEGFIDAAGLPSQPSDPAAPEAAAQDKPQ
jgi:hypothetical protein